MDSGRLLTLADGAPAIPLYDYECGETTTTTSVGESVEAEGWTVSGTAERLGVSRVALSRVLNGRAGVSAALALALERIGWSDAEHWIRMQAIYDVAQERRKQAGVAA